MNRPNWTPGTLIDGKLSYRLRNAFIFKFFHYCVYQYPIYTNKGVKTGETERRFSFSYRDSFDRDDNLYTIDSDIFQNSAVKNKQILLLNHDTQNMYKVSEKVAVSCLRCITYEELTEMYRKQGAEFYYDINKFMFLFDTTFSWCIKLTHDTFFGAPSDFNQYYIALKVYNQSRLPKYIKEIIADKTTRVELYPNIVNTLKKE